MTNTEPVSRYVLIGVHLKADDADVAAVRAFGVGEIAVSALPIGVDTPLADRELMTRVMEARRQLLDRETFIAIRYGASARSSEEIREKLGPHTAKWKRTLEKWRGHVEATLKIAASQKAERPDIASVSGGREYLERLHASRTAFEPPAAMIESINSEFAFAAQKRWIRRADGGMEFAALLPRNELQRLSDIGMRLTRDFPSTPFLLSAPWPLEVFGDE